MSRTHHYALTVTWTGNTGAGTSNAAAYARSHTLTVNGKEPLECSSDTAFRGDASKYNPEDMLVYALSSCHMLWYLHLCADAGVVVTNYEDHAEGTMVDSWGTEGGRFTEVILKPVITVAHEDMVTTAIQLHEAAHKKCFIANSCNFPIRHVPEVIVATK